MTDFMREYGLTSATLSAGGNQIYITENIPDGIGTGLIFVRLFRSGTFNFRLAYSGLIDGTFWIGDISKCNDPCDWKIESLGAAVTKFCGPSELDFVPVLFDGKPGIYVENKEMVLSDSFELTAEKNDYLCIKIEFSGRLIPCHRESIAPVYRLTDNGYEQCNEVPFPVFTGIEYEAEKRICFFGDSITQGIGSTFNSYKNYAAVAAEILGEKYAYWNIGLGFGRGSDAASDGIWLAKAKLNDIVSVCYGVNDILKEGNCEKLKSDLTKVATELKKAGVKVLIQTIPPFDYEEKEEKIWLDANDYIRNELSQLADGFFDNVPILKKPGTVSASQYGGHPDDEGCDLWGKALAPTLSALDISAKNVGNDIL